MYTVHYVVVIIFFILDSKENASSLQSDLVCCSTQQPLDLSSSHTYTSATNPGDSVGSNCSYQHQSSSEAVDDGDQSSVG